MLHLENTVLHSLAIHHVGNQSLDEALNISEELVSLSDENLTSILTDYFLSELNDEELYRFDHTGSLENNTAYMLVSEFFAQPDDLLEVSKSLADLLYKLMQNPRLKSGELFVAYFKDIVVDDELTDALGLFKSDSLEYFMQITHEEKNTQISILQGLSAKRPSNACLILNIAGEEGFRLCIPDKINRSYDTQFWKEEFLSTSVVQTNYYQTQQFMKLTKSFVTDQMAKEHESERTEQIEILNRSADYFKQNDVFEKSAFVDAVFDDKNMQNSFQKFESDYLRDHDLDLDGTFSISPAAVKKQSKIFKSVIKLDKNFHIYVHGDKNRIERGTDADGRKFYKLFYEDES